jgi:SAM-dependent methyltransferase
VARHGERWFITPAIPIELAFLNLGFDVVSIDASAEMVRATKELTGLDAWQLGFQELDFDGGFDGIWACASLLHVTRRELSSVLARLARALKSNGVLDVSFKYGDDERVEDGRLFNDRNDARLCDALANHPKQAQTNNNKTGSSVDR